jgi:methyl coenzyme M reductase subunit C-like uncharacterized protein (methanogenesis marker protein 7)
MVGYEWDNRDPEGDGNRLWDAAKSRITNLDEGRLQVLFTGSPVDLNGKSGNAEAVYFGVGSRSARLQHGQDQVGMGSWAWL